MVAFHIPRLLIRTKDHHAEEASWSRFLDLVWLVLSSSVRLRESSAVCLIFFFRAMVDAYASATRTVLLLGLVIFDLLQTASSFQIRPLFTPSVGYPHITSPDSQLHRKKKQFASSMLSAASVARRSLRQSRSNGCSRIARILSIRSMSSSSNVNGEEDMHKLCHSLADALINGPLDLDDDPESLRSKLHNEIVNLSVKSGMISNAHQIPREKPRIVLAVAGGGSPALSALTSTPNASRVLVEGVVCYDRRSFANFVGAHPAPSTEVVADLLNGSSKGSATYSAFAPNSKGQFSFSSPTAAELLSNAALHRALELSPSLGEMAQCIGVGCASALVSQGRPDKSSRAHIVVTTSKGNVMRTDLKMSKEGTLRGDESKTNVGRRIRRQEDDMVGSLILASVLQSRASMDDEEISFSDSATIIEAMLSREGDGVDLDPRRWTPANITDDNLLVQSAAESIITGEADVVVLVSDDSGEGSGGEDGGTTTVMMSLCHAVLPPDPLIFPGSFNPPHVGHVALANAAVKAMMRKRAQERKDQKGAVNTLASSWGKLRSMDSNLSGESDNGGANTKPKKGFRPELLPLASFNDASTHSSVWGAADHQDYDEKQPTVLFEMSLTNPDKPPMEAKEAARRVGLFGSCLGGGATSSERGAEVNMPEDWGVLMTSAPLFVQKVGVLGRYVAPSGASIPFLEEAENEDGDVNTKIRRKMTFVIGTDTMVRIIDPKYYEGYDGMLAAVREMGDAGVHFVVGGRLEQGKEEGDEPKFITGEEELTSLPADVRDMFTIIREDDFRLDVSSTELRKRASATTSA